MKSLCKPVLALAIVFSLQNAALCADIESHRTALKNAQSSIDSLKKEMTASKWYPQYHLAPFAGAMNHPNAIVYFNNAFHLFYEQDIKLSDGKIIPVWAHMTSSNLLHWKKQPLSIAANEEYDKDGVFAGSAIFDNNLLNVFYTGYSEKKVNDKIQKTEVPCLATSKDGMYFGKSANNPLIKNPPKYLDTAFFAEEVFRDPFVWKQGDKYYALMGTQYEKTKDGAVLLFKSADLRNWEFVDITAIGSKGEMGSSWDCPNFLHIGADDVLIINPTGIKPQGNMFLNKYISGAFIGKLDYNTAKFKQKGPFTLLDYGFDFYAPQSVKAPDGRTIIIGWLGMPDSVLHESSENWSGMMTLPRELKIVNGKLSVAPIEELKQLRAEQISHSDIKINGQKEFFNLKGDAYEIETEIDLTNAASFSIKLRESKIQDTTLTYDKASQMLKLNRDRSGHALKGQREVKLPLENNLLKLRIFVDRSSVEVFVNNIAMTARIYPDKASSGIKFVSNGEAVIKNLNFYRLKSVYD